MVAQHYTTTSTFYEFSLSSLVGSKVRVLVQDLYGHDTVCVVPNPLAKTWESNSGPYLRMTLVLPTHPHFRSHERRKKKFVKSGHSSVVLCTHSVPQPLMNLQLLSQFLSGPGFGLLHIFPRIYYTSILTINFQRYLLLNPGTVRST